MKNHAIAEMIRSALWAILAGNVERARVCLELARMAL